MLEYLQTYGVIGFIRLMRDVINTKLFFPACRLIRQPYYIKRRKYIHFGKRFTAGVGLRVDVPQQPAGSAVVIEFGDDVQVNDYVHITGINSIKIGNHVLIASKVFISDHNHGTYKGSLAQSSPLEPPNDRALSIGKIVIEDNVWIGEFVSVMPDVTIGKGAIIGSMSVVTKDIPPYTIAVGSPAKVIKRFNFETKGWEGV